jgi:hypothetical protein
MTLKSKLDIIKVPLPSPSKGRDQVFARMPRLYLELLENKAKIKQDLINVEYTHRYSDNDKHEDPPSLKPTSPDSDDSDDDDDGYSYTKDNKHIDEKQGSDDERSYTSKKTDTQDEKDEDDDISSIGSKSPGDDEPSISKRLTDLLGDDSDNDTVSQQNNEKYHHKKINKYSKQRDKQGHSITRNNTVPPSFAELEAQGAYVPRQELRDINNVSTVEQNQDDLKRELLFKFELLRKSYPEATVPEYSVHTEYKVMLSSYEDCVRRLSLDSTVENYKQYLIYAFMGIEFLLGKFLKLDMEGFTKQQILSMSSYERLLIELGEKSYVPEGSQWSVEVRLLGLVIMNTAFFVVSKMIMAKTSVNLMNMMNGMSSAAKQMNEESTTGAGKTRAKKMRGPDIDLDEI